MSEGPTRHVEMVEEVSPQGERRMVPKSSPDPLHQQAEALEDEIFRISKEALFNGDFDKKPLRSALLAALQRVQAETREEDATANSKALAALEALRHEHTHEKCWCDVAIGNPMMSHHSYACQLAALAETALSRKDRP